MSQIEDLLNQIRVTHDSLVNNNGQLYFSSGDLEAYFTQVYTTRSSEFDVEFLLYSLTRNKEGPSQALDGHHVVFEDESGERYSSQIRNGQAKVSNIPYESQGAILNTSYFLQDVTHLIERYIPVWIIKDGTWSPTREDYVSPQFHMFWEQARSGALTLHVSTSVGYYCALSDKKLVIKGDRELKVNFKQESFFSFSVSFMPPLEGEFELEVSDSLPEP